MTRSPHTIGHEETLATAHRMMRNHSIRHLPVLSGGRLVGLLSDRDVHLVETLKDVDPTKIAVSEAMTAEVFAVAPRSPLRTVVSEMAEHKYGCAVVLDGRQVVGVFTTVDALKALAGLLEPDPSALPR